MHKFLINRSYMPAKNKFIIYYMKLFMVKYNSLSILMIN